MNCFDCAVARQTQYRPSESAPTAEPVSATTTPGCRRTG